MTWRGGLVLGLVALGWTGLCLALWRGVDALGPLVFRVGEGFGVAPARLVWLADLLEEAAPATRLVVGLVWLLGLLVVLAAGLLLARDR
ncbi:MAG: hypothetical protein NZM40_08175 [Sphingomonadaceae bacterium]|uniref:hypothetical protein n=1 Tax=Thermaurantiacus sp. TaxID=2820283 RepID=UPI00298F2978|nr:hypothetical protein [Thermaurantiacus sp.]MCS6987386.1 hypothetical protein [Sphingomonadaceae bacterium]MDW8415306.1 hypothetical protein [Thermaurantiacus sp.]